MEIKMSSVISRGFFLFIVTGPLFSTYFWINQRTQVTHSQVFMPEWVPFFPQLALPYFAVLLTPAIGIFLIKNDSRFRRYVISFIPSYGAIALVWIFFPTEMLRPEVAQGILNQPYRDLISVDRPVCILPCGHIVGPMLLTWALAGENRWHLRWLIPFLSLASISTVATWQHRPVDVVIGIVISIGGALVTRTLWDLFKRKPHSATMQNGV
ncbi:hypothetical protein OAK89_05790 [Akkermansiaceae bacterium]|nr:hypothetical protein [Akkermansiaceae bacterium]MDB4641779.1 hypothetical protein [bacterium]MDB4327764.1 hypothetical protein [Akkermansiaceae bacterium]MDB4629906.1 hypothetical protein [Akkermansiaceae bacterium]MDB4693635.1 hypothetical protein [Akkermansiaceae bacterium]